MQKVKHEQTNQQTIWTKQQKKKYLKLITLHLTSLNARIPRNFYNEMKNDTAKNKTIKQCRYFHLNKKRGCSSLEDLITKVAQQIDQDPSLFIKNQNQIEMKQKQQKNFFESLQQTKSIKEILLEKFLQNFNPYEIIFKSSDNPLNKLVYNNQQKPFFSGWESVFYRSLEEKLYPIEDETQHQNQDKEKVRNLPEEEDVSSEDYTIKKKSLIIKRSQKQNLSSQSQQKNHEFKISESKQKWDALYLKILVFLLFYKKEFQDNSKRKFFGIYKTMSKFLKTPTSERCRDYFQFLLKKNKDLDGIIDYLHKNITTSKGQIQEEISNIQEFYQAEIQRQMVGLNPVRFSLWIPGNNNKFFITEIIKKTINFVPSTNKTNQSELGAEKQNLKVQNVPIEINLPIVFEVFLIKQQKSDEKKPNQEENEDIDNLNSRKRIQKKKQRYGVTKKKNRQSSEVYFSDDDMKDAKKDNQDLPKMKKEIVKWTISQNIKFLAYLMVNRYFFEDQDVKDKNGIIVKLSQFLQTDKTISQCSTHFMKWKLVNDKDFRKVIEQKSQQFGLTEQMIEQRKKKCRQFKTTLKKIGDAILEVDHSPAEIEIKKEDFSEQTVLSKIYEAEPYLSFYLRFQEKGASEKKEPFGKKNYFPEENFQEFKGQASSEIRTSVKLTVPSQKFDKLNECLKMDPNQRDHQGSYKKKITVKTNLIYKFLIQN